MALKFWRENFYVLFPVPSSSFPEKSGNSRELPGSHFREFPNWHNLRCTVEIKQYLCLCRAFDYFCCNLCQDICGTEVKTCIECITRFENLKELTLGFNELLTKEPIDSNLLLIGQTFKKTIEIGFKYFFWSCDI